MIRPRKIHWEPRDYLTHGELYLNEPGSPLPHRISYEGTSRTVAWAPNAQFVHYAFTFGWMPGGSCCGDQGPRCGLIGPILDALPIEQLLRYGAPIEVGRITVVDRLRPPHSNGRRVHIHFKFRAPTLTSMSFEDASAEMQTVLVILDRAIERAFAESETPTAQAPVVAAGHAKT